MSRLLYQAGWEILRVLIGLPVAVMVSAWAAAGAFYREFGREWEQRARAGESSYWWRLRQETESEERPTNPRPTHRRETE